MPLAALSASASSYNCFPGAWVTEAAGLVEKTGVHVHGRRLCVFVKMIFTAS